MQIRAQYLFATIRWLGRNLARARHDQSGAVSFTIGLMSTALLGVVGLTVDVGDWYFTKASMQVAADAAAIGGATQLAAGGTNGQAISATISATMATMVPICSRASQCVKQIGRASCRERV